MRCDCPGPLLIISFIFPAGTIWQPKNTQQSPFLDPYHTFLRWRPHRCSDNQVSGLFCILSFHLVRLSLHVKRQETLFWEEEFPRARRKELSDSHANVLHPKPLCFYHLLPAIQLSSEKGKMLSEVNMRDRCSSEPSTYLSAKMAEVLEISWVYTSNLC